MDRWLTTAPDEPRAHHLRGKALLALDRLPDARAAFDRACTLRPQLLEAMLPRLAPATADEAYELRSRALAAIGRAEEAGVQMSTYLRLIEQRSDRRIGSR